MNLDVKSDHLTNILTILKTYLPKEANIYVFGSRAKNCAKPYSDLDLAIELNKEKLNFSTLAKLTSAFENTTIPYAIDIIDLNSISTSFKKNIKNDLIKLNIH